MKKKILFLDTGREWGGGTNSLLLLLRHLDKNTFACTVCFYSNYSNQVATVAEQVASCGCEFIQLEPPRLPLMARIAIKLGRIVLPIKALSAPIIHAIDLRWRVMPLAQALSNVIKDRGIDLIYLNNQPSSNLEGAIAGVSLGIPVVQHCRKLAQLSRYEINLFNSSGCRLIHVSEGLMASYIRQGLNREQGCVIYNGIEANQYPIKEIAEARHALNLKSSAFIVGTVCTLVKNKRVDVLLRAVGRLAMDPLMDIICLVVGEGPERRSLERLARDLGIFHLVRFTGFQVNAFDYISCMDVFTLNSKHEAFGRAALEAMVMGKPVVITRTPGCRELVVDNESGLMYPVDDDGELADRLEFLLRDVSERKRLGDNARRRAMELFSHDRYIDAVSAILR